MDADSVDGTYLTRGPDKRLPTVLSWRAALLNDPDALLDVDRPDVDPWDGAYVLAAGSRIPRVPALVPAPSPIALF